MQRVRRQRGGGGDAPVTCPRVRPRCGQPVARGSSRLASPASNCGGTGTVARCSSCVACSGSGGTTRVLKKFHGAPSRRRQRRDEDPAQGKGEPGSQGGPPGDLLCHSPGGGQPHFRTPRLRPLRSRSRYHGEAALGRPSRFPTPRASVRAQGARGNSRRETSQAQGQAAPRLGPPARAI